MRIAFMVIAVTVLAICAARGQAPGTIPPPVTHPKSGDRVTVPEPSEKAMERYRTGNVLWCFRVALAICVPSVFLFTGFSAKIRDFAMRVGRRWFFGLNIYFISFTLIVFLFYLPLDFYQGFIRPHSYGLSNQTALKWWRDTSISLAIELAGGCLLLWIPYLLINRSPRRWWIYTSILLVPFIFATVLIWPVWIEPLFNRFGELQDKPLEAKILALADRAGIKGSRVFEVAKSEDTKTLNAYVTGFLGTKRIVLWDTTLEKLDEREVLAIMGHEMGHYVLGHVVQGILLSTVGIFVMLFLVHHFSACLIRRFKGRFGFDRLADFASYPLLLLLIELCNLTGSPVALAVSRHIEHEADRFGLEITRDNHAAATAFVKMQYTNLSNPRPGMLFMIFRSSHPPIGERIDFCNEYRPWEKGEPLKYEHLIRK